jgi:predicted branched-subunit amino acid permease
MEIFGVYGLDTVVIIAFAVFYYKIADIESTSKLLWTGLSIVCSLLCRILGFGLLGLVLGQIILFVAIALMRLILRRKNNTPHD